MSDDPLAMFSAVLAADETMRTKLSAAIGQKTGAAAIAALSDFAAEQKFELTEGNLTQLHGRLDATEAEGELSDAQLDGVAGGKIAKSDVPDNMLSLLTALKATRG